VLAALRRIPGVVAAEPRITTGVVLSVGDEIGDNFGQVVGGTDAYYRQYLQGPQKVLSGGWLSGAPKEAVLGRALAGQLKANVGEKVLLLGQTQDGSLSSISVKLVGVVGGDALLDQQAYLGLEDARYLADMAGGALEVLVWTNSLEPAVVGPVARSVTRLPAFEGLVVQPWYEREPLASMLPVLSGETGFIQLLIVFMAAVAIFNTMTMSVLERTTEIGVLRAMGLTRLGAVGLFVLEGLVIGLVGGIGGTLLGAIPAWYFQVHGVTLAEDMIERVGTLPIHATMHAQLTSGIVVQSLMVGLGIAIIGAFLPALRAASIRPVTAMHARR
jgi:ABC-type lipoprotein release transport system permease subunit